MTRKEAREKLRKFGMSPAGQHRHPDFIFYWEYRAPAGFDLDVLTTAFHARRVPLLLSGENPYMIPDLDVDYVFDMMMKEKSLIETIAEDN